MDKESRIEKLRKIKALADNGVSGEAIAAQEALDRLLKEYGLTLEDISDEQRKDYDFKYSNERDGVDDAGYRASVRLEVSCI